MAAKSPRVHTVLEGPLYEAVERLARRDGVSLSQKVRDLVRDALELMEDAALDEVAGRRRAGFNRRRALTPEQIRARLGARRAAAR